MFRRVYRLKLRLALLSFWKYNFSLNYFQNHYFSTYSPVLERQFFNLFNVCDNRLYYWVIIETPNPQWLFQKSKTIQEPRLVFLKTTVEYIVKSKIQCYDVMNTTLTNADLLSNIPERYAALGFQELSNYHSVGFGHICLGRAIIVWFWTFSLLAENFFFLAKTRHSGCQLAVLVTSSNFSLDSHSSWPSLIIIYWLIN